MIRDLPFLLRRLFNYMGTYQGMVYFIKMVIGNLTLISLIVYIISPFDLIPEAIFGVVGRIDYLIVFLGIFIVIANNFYIFLALAK